MKSTIVVTYAVKLEAMSEHLGLIEGVFGELASAAPTDVGYQVFRLRDGVSFVHVSTADTIDGSNPLTELESFKAFSASLPERVASKPVPSQADIIGSYRPAS